MEARPLDALNRARDKKVIVECKNNRQYVGTLRAFDIHINVVLDETEERVEGELKRKLGTAFIRGDTIVLISPAWVKALVEQDRKENDHEEPHTSPVDDAAEIATTQAAVFAPVAVLENQANDDHIIGKRSKTQH